MKLNYTIEKYNRDDRQGWLITRGFGGSSVSAILGKNKYMSALDLYCSAINPSVHKEESNTPSTIYGQQIEPVLAQLFKVNYPQYKITYPKKIEMARRIDKPFITYTYDNLLTEVETNRKGFGEFKSHDIQSREDEENWASGQLPMQYYIQVLQGFVTMNDKEFCELYAILNHRDYTNNTIKYSELRHYHIERNDVINDITYIEKVETDFQHNHIDKRIPPNIHVEL